MPRLTRAQALQHAHSKIAAVIKGNGPRVIRLDELRQILDENRGNWILPKVTRFDDFCNFIIEKKLIQEVPVKMVDRVSPRFVTGDVSPAEIALSLRDNSYLTHYTALFLHGLTINIPKTVYSNLEQTPKPASSAAAMTQDTIDLAFSRPMRTTNNIAEFELVGGKYRAFLLNGQYQNRLGVTEIDFNGRRLPITTMERTLIDIAVRPAYAGGVNEVLQAYLYARDKISVNTLLATLKGMKFNYPYQQAIGFYLERAGYKETVIRLAEKFSKQFDFYLTYQIKNKKLSKKWRVYYPAELD